MYMYVAFFFKKKPHSGMVMGCVMLLYVSQAATSGIHKSIVAFEPEQTFLDRGRERIEGSIGKLVSKGKMTKEDADKTLASINFTTDIQALKDTDFIVEAGKTIDFLYVENVEGFH